ncbi:MAG: SDR family NAD(P)-dependent oxidoreductase, partial [Myxococcota bacterium]|nr:SDR family NAD(P)-dependent oxidoreductase [Myxococcota bacterium]
MSDKPKAADTLKRAFLAVERAKTRVRELEEQRSEPIAIVSMACRYPGNVTTPEELWSLLDEGRHGITEVPKSRFDVDAYFDPDPEAAGKTYTRWGGFLGDLDSFDASFFGIPPREAKSVDPQERLLLETTWELFERVGIVPENLMGSSTGVYVGLCSNEYGFLGGMDETGLDAYSLLGTAHSAMVGRISYWLGLEGPNFPVDTACSSSLVSLHLACQGLRNGDCDMAVAGGVNTMLSAFAFVYFSRLRAMSPTGRCHTFSQNADGYVRAEGCGLVLLKRLSDAKRDGDEILALVRGSAVNQDGKSNGFTAPNGPAQQAVIRRALSLAKLDPASIDYVECHGTGTSLGDPIEVQALAAVYGEQRDEARPIVLGSLKSNIGHAEGAAGIGGVLKTVLALQHDKIPETLNVAEPNPHIPWDSLPVELATESRSWETNGKPRRAGVSSFGFSGTNAHVILEEAPSREQDVSEQVDAAEVTASALPPAPLLISSRDEVGLREQAKRWGTWLADHPSASWSEVIRTAALSRTHFPVRAALTSAEPESVREALAALAQGEAHALLAEGRARETGKVVFVFPGQGSQWEGMGRALLQESDVFREAIRECDQALEPLTGWSVTRVLRGDEGEDVPSLERVDVVQPALFAISIGLAAVWRDLGVEPAAVVGHSQGEVGAAVVAGGLTLADAAKVVVARSSLVRKIAGHGAMAVVELSADAAEQRIARFDGAVSVAVVNTATSTVVSGDLEAIDTLLSQLDSEGTYARKVNVDYASHSVHVDAILPELQERLKDVQPHTPSIPFYSTVTGKRIEGANLGGRYWCRNLREAVRLDRALDTLMQDGHGVFIEASAHPVLAMPLTTACAESGGVAVGSLKRDEGGLSQVYAVLGQLHCQGYQVAWSEHLGETDQLPVQLPTYAFQRERHWLDGASSTADVRAAGLSSAEHPLLGAATALADTDGYLLTGRLSRRETAWLADHQVFSTTLFPGVGLLELAMAAAQSMGGTKVSSLTLSTPLVIPERGGVCIQVAVKPGDVEGERALKIYSRADDGGQDSEWTEHATGSLGLAEQDPAMPAVDLRAWPPAGADVVDLEGFYQKLHAGGLEYGPTFQGLEEAYTTEGGVYARVTLADSLSHEADDYGLHPALFDSALHAMVLATAELKDAESGAVMLPFAWSDVVLHATGARELRVHVGVTPDGSGQSATAAITLCDGTGNLVAQVGGLMVRRATMEQLRSATQSDSNHLYRVEWQPVLVGREAWESESTVVLGGDGALAETLGVPWVESLDRLLEQTQAEAPLRRLIIDVSGSHASELIVEGAATLALGHLELLQRLLVEDALLDTELIWVTRGAVSSGPDEGVLDLMAAPLWGLLRTARSENPGRVVRSLDLSMRKDTPEALTQALMASHESECALRFGKLLAARLVKATTQEVHPPEQGPWKLDVREKGRLDQFIASPLEEEPLASGHVRVAIRAAGMNFRDVLNVLDMVPVPWLGLELAGVVTEIGSDVTTVRVGDRVLGMGHATFATTTVADARLITQIPDCLTFAEAATIPLVFLTAKYALDDLASMRTSDRVLIHAAAGGVGMAATQLALHRGAEVFGTASQPKWDALRTLGLDEAHIASSRDLSFGPAFRDTLDGDGLDIVLNALAGDFVDSSLGLLRKGGRFLEMGKTDIRTSEQIATGYPDVGLYHALDLIEAGNDRIQELLVELMALFDEGVLKPLPFTAYDLRDAPAAFRFMANARHVGKIVLTVDRPLDPGKTVLITGGTGELGCAVARHLIAVHGCKHLVLTSRRGMEAPGAHELQSELLGLGADSIVIAACDVTQQVSLETVLAKIGDAHPLGSVFHLAGVLDDGVLTDLTEEQLTKVMAPKVVGAWLLHTLTSTVELDAFVLFSSVAGAMGGPGQGNYAAANTFMDALVSYRRVRGLAALSLAWGFWEQAGVGMTAHLGGAELARMRRQGMMPMPVDEGLGLLDQCL